MPPPSSSMSGNYLRAIRCSVRMTLGHRAKVQRPSGRGANQKTARHSD